MQIEILIFITLYNIGNFSIIRKRKKKKKKKKRRREEEK
jgi:preprotein translocase subunit YajC